MICNKTKDANESVVLVACGKKGKQKTRKASLEFRTTCEPDNRRFEKILFELMVLSQMVVNHLSNSIITHDKEMSIPWTKNIISALI